MNKSVKIILLVVAILLAVGGVMVYYKTIVSPPGKLTFQNQYVNSDKKDISRVKSAMTDLAFDSSFVAITHEIEFQWSNSLLNGNERNELLNDFAKQYIAAYVEVCNNKFNQSVWNEKDLQRISSRISELRSLITTDKKPVVQDAALASLNKVDNVIQNYYAAKRTAIVSGYNGLQPAKKKIADAKRYASMSPINNCSDLVSRLNSVAARLERAHYSYLAGQVERLRAYYNYSQSEYDNLAISVQDKLAEYKSKAKSIYGRVSDITPLVNRAGNYYSNASFY